MGPTDISRFFSWTSVVDEESPSTDTMQGCGLHSTTRRFCLFGIRRPRPIWPAMPLPLPCMMTCRQQTKVSCIFDSLAVSLNLFWQTAGRLAIRLEGGGWKRREIRKVSRVAAGKFLKSCMFGTQMLGYPRWLQTRSNVGTATSVVRGVIILLPPDGHLALPADCPRLSSKS